MTIDIERLKHDLDYWKECDPTEGGATHYDVNDGGESAWILRGNGWAYWNSREGWQSGFKPFSSSINNFIPRPSPAWDGSGLPPVGVECEYRPDPKLDEWQWCVFIGTVGAEAFVLTANDDVDRMMASLPGRFRPLKTEKDRVVEAALALDEYPRGQSAGGMMSRKDFCAKLYDAGALKMPRGEV